LPPVLELLAPGRQAAEAEAIQPLTPPTETGRAGELNLISEVEKPRNPQRGLWG